MPSVNTTPGPHSPPSFGQTDTLVEGIPAEGIVPLSSADAVSSATLAVVVPINLAPASGQSSTGGGTPTFRAQLLSYTPALYWPLDAVYGATDQANSWDGTAYAGVGIGGETSTYAPIVSADPSSTNFDGTDDIVYNDSVTNHFFEGNRTYIGWIYVEGTGDDQPFFATPLSSTLVGVNHTGSVYFRVNGTGTTLWTDVLGTGQWKFFALTFSDSTDTCELFVDGVSQGSKAQTGTAADGRFRVGQTAFAGQMASIVSHVAVIESVLTAQQIADLYAAKDGTGAAGPFLTAPALLSLSAAGSSAATLVVTTNAPVPTGTAAGQSNATLALTAPTKIVLSPAVGQSSTGGAVFDASTVSGLETWWKADALGLNDGDAVTSWSDSSGNGWTLSGTGPTYKTNIQNSKPIVRFDGADDVLTTTSAPSWTNLTVFIVVKIDVDPPVADAQSGLWELGGELSTHFPYPNGIIYDGAGSTARKSTSDPTLSLASWRLYEVKSTAGEWTAWIDRTQHFTTATNTVGGIQAAHTQIRIGQSRDAYYLDGDIGEILLYDAALGSTDRATVEDYLGGKWGLGWGSAPSSGVFLTAPTQIPLGAAAGTATATLTVTTNAPVPTGTAAGQSSATLALTAQTRISLDAAAGLSSATLVVTTIAPVPLSTAAGASTATLALSAATVVPLDASAGQSAATLALNAPTTVPLDAAAGTSSATLALTAQTYIPLDPAAGQSDATLDVTAPSTAVGDVPLDPAHGLSDASLAITAPTLVALDAAAGISSAVLILTAKTEIPLDPSGGLSNATLILRILVPAPETHPDLGGDLDELPSGGVVAEPSLGGVFAETNRGGSPSEATRSGAVGASLNGSTDETLTGAEAVQALGGSFSESVTGGTFSEGVRGAATRLPRGGVVHEPKRGADADNGSTGGEVDDGDRAGNYDVVLTGAEVF